MKLIFAGTPAFAVAALDALVDAGHEVVQVLTQPDRPAGRGLKLQAPAVKLRALARRLPLLQPGTLKDPAITTQLAVLNAEIMIVAAYGLMIPETLLRMPPRGCVNIHASLLPRWRGAAPIQRALLAGDSETGVTIMQMDAGLDTGAILLSEAVPIAANDTAQKLHDKLAALGARLILRALGSQPAPVPQDGARATYAKKITKAETGIDWTKSAAEISRLIRAFNPLPGAHTTWHGQTLKVWRAELISMVPAAPVAYGTILQAGNDGIIVATGGGAIRLLELQRAGGRRLAPSQFLAGTPIDAGTRFDA